MPGRTAWLCAAAVAALALLRWSRPRPAPSPPKVALGFRDGSTADLDPASEPARALRALAAELLSVGPVAPRSR